MGRDEAVHASSAEGDVNSSPHKDEWQAGHIGAVTRKLLEADAKWFLHQSLSTPCLNAIAGAEGIYLIDVEGRRIMDFHGNSVHQAGYGHPRVVAAVRQEIESLPFCPRRYTNKTAIDFAERLCRLAPGRLDKVLFAPGGAAAVGMALKLARHVTGRHKTLSMWDAFHGASLDAISVGGEALFRQGVGPLLTGAEHVPPPGLAKRFFGDDDTAYLRLADYIDYVLSVQGDVGAFVAEPMRWTAVQPPVAAFWQRVRASCDKYGTLLIFDEIPSALGRTGSMFVTEQTGVVPDMLVLGKGLGGGIFPLAALIACDDLDVLQGRALGHYTHEKSPVGCAAGLAMLDVIRDEELTARAATLGAEGLRFLYERLGALACVVEIRGLGLYIGIELADADLADRAMYRCLSHGLSFKIGGGNVITLCPPLTITRDELIRGLTIVADALVSL